MMKWFFVPRLSVHLYDLMTIPLFCPDVYSEFVKGNFAFQKTGRKFSKISLDQVHEQNSEVIKGFGRGNSFLNRECVSGLMRWELSGTEVTCLLNEFEDDIFEDQCNLSEKQPQEYTSLSTKDSCQMLGNWNLASHVTLLN